MTINTEAQHKEALRRFEVLEKLGIDEHPELQLPAMALALAIEDYQIRIGYFDFSFEKPETLPAMIDFKRRQKELKQKDLAALLEIPAGRLSQILSGKRRVTIDLAKKLYERLNISADFILKTV